MEVTRNKEENTKLRSNMTEIRNRLADLEARVCITTGNIKSDFFLTISELLLNK